MNEYDEVVRSSFLQTPLDVLYSCLQQWRVEQACFHINSLLRGVAKKGIEHLREQSKKSFQGLSRAAWSNRITRSHKDNLGGLWGALKGNPGSLRTFLKSMVSEFATVASTVEKLIQTFIDSGPPWFRKLPVLTLFAMFSYAVFCEVYVVQQTLKNPTEEERYTFLEGLTCEDYDYVRNGFNEAFEHIFKTTIINCISYFESALPDRLHDLNSEAKRLLKLVLSFVKETDEILPYLYYTNHTVMDKIRKGWKAQCDIRRGGLVLREPPCGDEYKRFHAFSPAWIKIFNALLKEECSLFHTTRKSLMGCRELAKDYGKIREFYSHHGYLSDDNCFKVRDVRLQADVEHLWKAITAVSGTLVEKICEDEGLKAQIQKNGMSMFFKSVQSRVSIIKDSTAELCLALWIISIVCDDEGETYAKVCAYFMDI